MSQVASVHGDDFTATAEHDGTTITALLKGCADYAAVDAIDTLFDRIHAAARKLGVTETVIDLRQLEFMNSSCFKSFVTWIREIRELEEEQRYRITLVSNPKLHWQKRSLHSLRCFAIELVSVTESH